MAVELHSGPGEEWQGGEGVRGEILGLAPLPPSQWGAEPAGLLLLNCTMYVYRESKNGRDGDFNRGDFTLDSNTPPLPPAGPCFPPSRFLTARQGKRACAWQVVPHLFHTHTLHFCLLLWTQVPVSETGKESLWWFRSSRWAEADVAHLIKV